MDNGLDSVIRLNADERIRAKQQQVRTFADFHRPEVIAESKRPRVVDREYLKQLSQRNTRVDPG
jgi:hypothetical protein